MKKVLLSLFLTIMVSTMFGLIFYNNFINVFIICTILQFVIFYIGNAIYENTLKIKLEKVRTEQIKSISRNIATVECPCEEKFKQPVDIRFDRQISYTCEKCKKEIKADPFVNTFLKTDPIYFDGRV